MLSLRAMQFVSRETANRRLQAWLFSADEATAVTLSISMQKNEEMFIHEYLTLEIMTSKDVYYLTFS